MGRWLTITASTTLLWGASQAFAVDSASQPPPSKRQMIGQMINCMKKRMYADQTVSYNEAAKTCKAQIFKQNDTSGPLVASDTPAKR